MIVGLRHALYVGWVAGIAVRAGVDVELVDDALGNHTDRLVLRLHDPLPNATIEIVVPPPPDDWVLPQ